MPLAPHRSRRRGRRLGVEALEERQMLSITVQPLGDLYPGGASSPSGFVQLGNAVYFAATDATHGAELWKTDGTAAGTQLVKDINPSGNSFPNYLTVYGDKLFFSANDGTGGTELWMSDGSESGTVRVKDVWAGANGSSPADLVVSGSNLYFAAATGTYGNELWMSDGTTGGTVLVKDIASGTGDSNPASLVDMGGTLYFSAKTVSGNELWKSTGTAVGTVMVKDIWAVGANGSNPTDLTAVNGTLYFTADDGSHGQEVWKSDGTAAGTSLLKDIYVGDVGSSPYSLMEMNGKVYFQADDGARDGVGQYGNELWTSDGTNAGTQVVKDIFAGTESSFPFFLTNANGTLYFQAEDADHGVELWKSDGTAAGTSLVKDLNPGTSWGDPSDFVSWGGYVFFSANSTPNGSDYELWRSSGTEASTQRVQDIRPGAPGSYPLNFAVAAGKVFFSADNGTTGREPYSITVTNYAPTDIALSASSIAENQPVGSVVGTLTTTDPDPDNTFTYALVAGDGATGNGSFTISGSQLLTKESFNYEGTNTYSVRIHSMDQDGLGVDQVFTITVTDVNEPPTNIALAGNTTPEQSPVGTLIGTLSAVDPEGQPVSNFSLPAGGDNDSFQIVGNQLKNKALLDYETHPTYSIQVRAADPAGNAATQTIQVVITDVNDAPTGITLAPSSVNEHQGIGVLVGTFSTTDPDHGDTNFTYAMATGQGDADNSWFTLSGNQLKTAGVFDYESRSSYSIRMRTTDAGGLPFEQAIAVQVANVNENPTDVTISANSIDEARPVGTAVGTLATADPDLGNTFTYTLVSGSGSSDNAYFSTSGNQLVTASVLDYEARSVYSVRVRSTDQGGLSIDKVMVISCLNVNEAPTDISLAPNSTEERQPVGTVIGEFGTIDPDLNDPHNYSLVVGTGSGDNGLFAISGNKLTNASLLNYHDRSSYSIRVRTTDQAGASYEKVFTIYLTQAAPTFTPGLYEPSSSWFSLRNSNTSGAADYNFGYGEPGAGWKTLVGDWNGDQYAGVGLYSPQSSTFYLTDSYQTGIAEHTFGYGEAGGGWIPLVGDWDGDGKAGVGLYDPKTSTFYLTNSLTTGFAEYTFGYGEPNAGWIPIVGDWNGDGRCGVGLYNPEASTFYLTNNLTSGYAENTFAYGEANGGWTPMVGDWNGDRAAGVGLFNPEVSMFYLTSAFVTGYAEHTFGYGEANAGWVPLVGDWNHDLHDGVGLYAPSTSTFYLTDNLAAGYADYTVVFGTSGHTYQPLVGSWTPKAQAAASAPAAVASSQVTPAASLPSETLSARAVDQIDLAGLVNQELGLNQRSTL